MGNSVTNRKFSLITWVKDVLTEHFRIRKFNSPLGYLFIAFVTVVLTFAIAKINFLVGAGIMGLLIGGGLVLVCLFDTKWGFYISTTASFFVFYFNRMINDALPVGVVIDIFITITFVGIYFRKTMAKGKYWEFSKNPITYVYFLMVLFLLIEAFNPSMIGFNGWVFSFRKFLNFIMIYFTALHVFKSMDDVRQFVKIYLYLCILCGVYGCFQEWHGLLGFEEHWVTSDPLKWRLYFQGGTIRKWSLLSDPTSYGMLMAQAAILALVLAMGPATRKQRIYYVVSSMFMLMGMAYSGTRTATAMIPAGIVLFVLMTITSKKTLAFAISFLVLFVVLIFGPIHSNGTINRIRSTFEFSEDESFNIRDVNRHYIQPYMWRHPLGGGLATTGVQGEVYHPGHELAGFPPDSGYLKAALEMGPIGLLLTCIVYFTVMQVGIRNYYRTRDPEIRSYYVGMAASLFAIIVAHYAQVAIGQIPGAFLFYGAAAAMVKMRSFEKKSGEETEISILNQ